MTTQICAGAIIQPNMKGRFSLWLILTDPSVDDEENVLMVLCVPQTARTEDVTIIESDKIEGVHFSLSVDYENLSIKRAADIQDLIDRNLAIFRQILNSDLLTEAINGVRESDYSDYKYRDFLLAKGLL